MKDQSQSPTRLTLLPKYATIPSTVTQQTYTTRRNLYTPQKQRQILPYRQFQEYFGKNKPSFFQELQNIFANSSLEDKSPSLSPTRNSYNVQGALLSSRVNSIKRRNQVNKAPNNFTAEAFRVKEMYRKAKLNNLIEMRQKLNDDSLQQDEATKILRQSGQIVKQLKMFNRPKRSSWTPISKTHRTITIEKQSLVGHLNPHKRQTFTTSDLSQAIALLHDVKIRVASSISYFNVYIEQGNNSDLLKMLVRRRTGWRVVEIPSIANLIWTQFFRKGVLRKRLNRREKTQAEEDKSSRQSSFRTGRSSTKNTIFECSSPLKHADSNFPSQLRKLIPNSNQQQILQMLVPSTIKQLTITPNLMLHNHFPLNRCISDKKNLLNNLTRYLQKKGINVFQYVPESYELSDLENPIVRQIEDSKVQKQHWIIKPGENSNRGRGIIVTHTTRETLEELGRRFIQDEADKTDKTDKTDRTEKTQKAEKAEKAEKEKDKDKKKKKIKHTIVLQKYLVPLLYNNRKFDIRSYMLVTLLNNKLRIYTYQQCYIRTSCKPFDIESPNKLVHLTNDAIQCQSPQYGKYQQGNKVAQHVFSRYIDDEYKKKTGREGIWKQLKKQMDQRCIDVIDSSYSTLVSGLGKKRKPLKQEDQLSQEKCFYFELFGMDFMIDEKFKLWLIEVNTNPAITHDCSKVLNLLIPKMLDNMLTLAVEPIMKPLRVPETPFFNRFTAIYERNL